MPSENETSPDCGGLKETFRSQPLRERRVDFFIAGVQKGGTTALDAMLRQHPGIQMATRKEVHFFDNEKIDWSAPDHDVLHKHFDWSVTGVIRGEATPIYTYWPQSLERLARYNRHAKLVVCLRHPAFRAHSHWRMEVTRNADDLDFHTAIGEGRKRVASAPGGVHRIFSYIERGFYAPQIERAKCLFRDIHFLRTDRLWSDTRKEVGRLCRFLRIPCFEPERRYVVPVDTTEPVSITDTDLSYLTQIYADDTRETARLTGLELDDWLDPGYAEPMEPNGQAN